MIKAILCDLDGVVYLDGCLIDGAEAAINAIRNRKIPLKFLSNTSTKTTLSVCENLSRLGIKVDAREIVTPVSLALDFLRSNNQTAYLIVRESLKPYFEAVTDNSDQPDWVLIGDIGLDWNHALLNEILGIISKGPGILAMHKNAFAINRGDKVLDIGAFVTALEYSSKKDAVVLGKPTEKFFTLATNSFKSSNRKEILMIGDDPFADIQGGKDAGLTTAFVNSGKSTIEDLNANNIKPDYILNSLADIESIL